MGNPQPLENSYFWNRGGSPHSISTKERTIMMKKIDLSLMEICSNYHMHEKLQEHELS